MKTPMTSNPCCNNKDAATLLSTPPDMANTTRAINLASHAGKRLSRSLFLAGESDKPRPVGKTLGSADGAWNAAEGVPYGRLANAPTACRTGYLTTRL